MLKGNETLQTLADGVVVIDKNFKIISFSEGAERITGYKFGEVIGRNCEEIFKSDMCGEECPVTERNIETIIGISGRIDEVIETYLKGELKSGESTCEHTVPGHEIGHPGCE